MAEVPAHGLDLVLKVGVVVACAWETVFVTRSVLGDPTAPTISRGVGLRPWLGLPILAALAAHFYWPLLKKGKQ